LEGRGRVQLMSAKLLRHHTLQHPDNYHQDRAADAAARDLADDRAPIERRCSLRHAWRKMRKNLPADPAADNAGDRIAERSEIVILHRRAGDIAAYRARDQLDNQV